MTSKIIYISNECKWAKINLDNFDEKYERYSITMKMSKEDLKIFNSFKTKNTVKYDEDGSAWVQFSRKLRKEIGGEMVEFGMPSLYDSEGKEIVGDRPLIGNGSNVTAKITIYTTAMGTGVRLEAVKIDKLIEYKPMKGMPIGTPIEGLPF